MSLLPGGVATDNALPCSRYAPPRLSLAVPNSGYWSDGACPGPCMPKYGNALLAVVTTNIPGMPPPWEHPHGMHDDPTYRWPWHHAIFQNKNHRAHVAAPRLVKRGVLTVEGPAGYHTCKIIPIMC